MPDNKSFRHDAISSISNLYLRILTTKLIYQTRQDTDYFHTLLDFPESLCLDKNRDGDGGDGGNDNTTGVDLISIDS